MINVKPIAWETISQWPIASSGLPPRIVHRTHRLHLKTLGELRALPENDLRAVPGIGKESLQALKRFWTMCEDIVASRAAFPMLQNLLEYFLSRPQREILEKRCGLRRDRRSSLQTRRETLQQIGNDRRVCRERIRQEENRAKQILASHLAQACLREIYDSFQECVERHDGVMAAEDVAHIENDRLWGTFHPANLLCLLCDCRPPPPAFHRDYFTTWPIEPIRQIEESAIQYLRNNRRLIAEDEILSALADIPLPPGAAGRRRLILFVLNHLPAVSITTDNRFFLPDTVADHVLADIIGRLPQPAHFRDILTEYNRLMQPGSRKGSGFILDALRLSPHIRKVSSGRYACIPTPSSPSPKKTFPNTTEIEPTAPQPTVSV